MKEERKRWERRTEWQSRGWGCHGNRRRESKRGWRRLRAQCGRGLRQGWGGGREARRGAQVRIGPWCGETKVGKEIRADPESSSPPQGGRVERAGPGPLGLAQLGSALPYPSGTASL